MNQISKTDCFTVQVLLDFWKWGSQCQAIFSVPQIIRPAFLKTPNDKLKQLDTEKMASTMRCQKYYTPNNLAFPKFQTTDNTFRALKFQTPNNFAYPKCKHISTHSESQGVPAEDQPQRIINLYRNISHKHSKQ